MAGDITSAETRKASELVERALGYQPRKPLLCDEARLRKRIEDGFTQDRAEEELKKRLILDPPELGASLINELMAQRERLEDGLSLDKLRQLAASGRVQTLTRSQRLALLAMAQRANSEEGLAMLSNAQRLRAMFRLASMKGITCSKRAWRSLEQAGRATQELLLVLLSLKDPPPIPLALCRVLMENTELRTHFLGANSPALR